MPRPQAFDFGSRFGRFRPSCAMSRGCAAGPARGARPADPGPPELGPSACRLRWSVATIWATGALSARGPGSRSHPIQVEAVVISSGSEDEDGGSESGLELRMCVYCLAVEEDLDSCVYCDVGLHRECFAATWPGCASELFIQHMYSVLHVERSTITVLSQLRGLRLRYIEYLFKYIIFMLKIYYNSRLSGRQIDFGRQIDRQT